MIDDKQAAQFHRDGFLHLRSVFDPQRIRELHTHALTFTKKDMHGDLSRLTTFWDIAFGPVVVQTAAKLLNATPVYFGDSALNLSPSRGFYHSDARSDEGDRTSTSYPLIRFGIYLQDHLHYSGDLKIRRGSHRAAFDREEEACSAAQLRARGALSLSKLYRTDAVNCTSREGDLLVWNLRTLHSGGHTAVLRLLPKLSLEPRTDAVLPRWLKRSNHPDRVALFNTFGAPSEALERYIADRATDQAYHEFFSLSGLRDRSIVAQLESRGICVRQDCVQSFRTLSTKQENLFATS